MALLNTNVSSNLTTPGMSVPITFSYNHPSGSDWMVVIVAASTVNPTGVSFDGQAMTSRLNLSTTYYGFWRVFSFDMSDHTGSHTLSINTSTNYNPVITAVFSFSGASAADNIEYDLVSNGVDTITISKNSMIIANGWSGAGAGASVEIPQNTSITPLDYNFNSANDAWGAISDNLSAGNFTCEVNSSGARIIMLVEVEEASTSTSRRIIIV